MNWIVIAVVAAVILVAFYLLTELKRMKHKFFAVFVILVIVLFIGTAYFVFKDRPLDLNSFEGFKDASKVYMTFLGSAFDNTKTITSNAIRMDWSAKNTTLEPNLRDQK
ncbi:hypothetical protein COU57_01505 [Candidatus Pacearchaeota archaeon CG10_big_fil_rev_8_21_14_0_10_32_14]|nr:MAG: hypothetical protein COU57_01505 [Candidatus Pacearchaeota archaeon CG10_big_fil_rev_8_21_14_0_10_32_14]